MSCQSNGRDDNIILRLLVTAAEQLVSSSSGERCLSQDLVEVAAELKVSHLRHGGKTETVPLEFKIWFNSPVVSKARLCIIPLQ